MLYAALRRRSCAFDAHRAMYLHPRAWSAVQYEPYFRGRGNHKRSSLEQQPFECALHSTRGVRSGKQNHHAPCAQNLLFAPARQSEEGKHDDVHAEVCPFGGAR